MLTERAYSFFDFAVAISDATDLVCVELKNHHRRVAYIAYRLAKEMDLSVDATRDIVLAATLHDIGAFTSEERIAALRARFNDHERDSHPQIAYRLLRDFGPFTNAATLIRHHHTHFDKMSGPVPIGGHVLRMADRVAVLIDMRQEVLGQVPGILRELEENRSTFHPGVLAALFKLAKMEYFWAETCLLPAHIDLSELLRFPRETLDFLTVRALSKVVSRIIDFRSRFTATHSGGVAAVASELARICEFSERECQLLEIVGYLHDIGKLSISHNILEKSGALNLEEYNEMRKHPYYSYVALRKVEGFDRVALWAALHHERLDGTGYPFRVHGDDFVKLARIVAIADIITAITEDRPYRPGMDSEKALEILTELAENGGLDKGVVAVVRENFPRINAARERAQQEAQAEYKVFYELT